MLHLPSARYHEQVNIVHIRYHSKVDAVYNQPPLRYTLVEQTMKKTVSTQKRRTFRHGDLPNALVAAGLEMARSGGPNAVILREATRQAGVSPNAAYRHFASQAALLDAVRSACISRVAASIEEQMSTTRLGRDPQVFARKSLRAVGMGYLGFAMREPGMFRTAFSVPPPVHSPDPANTASMGLNPFQLLSLALDRMQESGLLSKKDRKDAEYLAWSTVHGWHSWCLRGRCRRCRRRSCWRWENGWRSWWNAVLAKHLGKMRVPSEDSG
jgi:AcrR family transcriptional regulator